MSYGVARHNSTGTRFSSRLRVTGYSERPLVWRKAGLAQADDQVFDQVRLPPDLQLLAR